MIFMPDIFIPVIGLILIFVIGFISRKKFLKNKVVPDPELNWKLILTMDLLYHLTIRAIY